MTLLEKQRIQDALESAKTPTPKQNVPNVLVNSSKVDASADGNTSDERPQQCPTCVCLDMTHLRFSLWKLPKTLFGCFREIYNFI